MIIRMSSFLNVVQPNTVSQVRDAKTLGTYCALPQYSKWKAGHLQQFSLVN